MIFVSNNYSRPLSRDLAAFTCLQQACKLKRRALASLFNLQACCKHENAARSRLRGLLSFLLCKGYHVKSIPGIGQSCKGGGYNQFEEALGVRFRFLRGLCCPLKM